MSVVDLPSEDHIRGILTAMQVVAEVVGPIKMDDMQQQTWTMICEINVRLSRIAADEVAALCALEGVKV